MVGNVGFVGETIAPYWAGRSRKLKVAEAGVRMEVLSACLPASNGR